MSIAPRGTSVQEAYRWFRDGQLLVNRRYQRKLVWTLEEKQDLIDSILRGYPIPLILLAEMTTETGTRYEIIDGMQRLDAVFSFIETRFTVEGKYFDLREFSRARLAAEQGLFERVGPDEQTIDPRSCADILDYQLAVTVFPPGSESDINDVFGRINSSGRQLSNQEKRQAGVLTSFAELVRRLAAEFRGDVSSDVLDLSQMPAISIESRMSSQGYGIQAEQTLWCRHGILSSKQLRESDDEDLIADIAASVLLEKPIARSKELLDDMYDPSKAASQDVETALAAYGSDKLRDELKGVFSIIDVTLQRADDSPASLRRVVTDGARSSSIKTPFYTIFMAMFELVVREQKSPGSPSSVLGALRGVASKLTVGRHYATEDERRRNIDLTKGLIQSHFVAKEPPDLGHGPGLALDFANSLRRSRIESSRYEMKQGVLRLDDQRTRDEAVIERLAETICGIANLGSTSRGYVYVGVADKKADAERISALDQMTPIELAGNWIVGIDREAAQQGLSLDKYVQWIVQKLQDTELSDPLKTDVLGKLDPVEYNGLTVLRIEVPMQQGVSYVGNRCFTRAGSSTVEAVGKELEAVVRRF
jgi:hypothetical protein